MAQWYSLLYLLHIFFNSDVNWGLGGGFDLLALVCVLSIISWFRCSGFPKWVICWLAIDSVCWQEAALWPSIRMPVLVLSMCLESLTAWYFQISTAGVQDARCNYKTSLRPRYGNHMNVHFLHSLLVKILSQHRSEGREQKKIMNIERYS